MESLFDGEDLAGLEALFSRAALQALVFSDDVPSAEGGSGPCSGAVQAARDLMERGGGAGGPGAAGGAPPVLEWPFFEGEGEAGLDTLCSPEALWMMGLAADERGRVVLDLCGRTLAAPQAGPGPLELFPYDCPMPPGLRRLELRRGTIELGPGQAFNVGPASPCAVDMVDVTVRARMPPPAPGGRRSRGRRGSGDSGSTSLAPIAVTRTCVHPLCEGIITQEGARGGAPRMGGCVTPTRALPGLAACSVTHMQRAPPRAVPRAASILPCVSCWQHARECSGVPARPCLSSPATKNPPTLPRPSLAARTHSWRSASSTAT
jgi:hypothetical protein